jgi:hypothetical protein
MAFFLEGCGALLLTWHEPAAQHEIQHTLARLRAWPGPDPGIMTITEFDQRQLAHPVAVRARYRLQDPPLPGKGYWIRGSQGNEPGHPLWVRPQGKPYTILWRILSDDDHHTLTLSLVTVTDSDGRGIPDRPAPDTWRYHQVVSVLSDH